MNVDNSSLQRPTIAADVEVGHATATLLRELLDKPKRKDSAWQERAGRAVSLLAVGFLRETDDVSALRAAALLTLAHSLGVNDARKQKIKLSRWASATPPALSTMSAKDEQRAAISVLSKVSAPWSKEYVEQCLVDDALPDLHVPDLLKWSRATFSNVGGFVREFYAPLVASSPTPSRAALLLKEATRVLRSAKPVAADAAAGLVALMLRATCAGLRSGAEDKKAYTSCVTSVLAVAKEQMAASPAVLLQPEFVQALGELVSFTAGSPVSKPVAFAADAFSLATVSLLMAEFARHGTQATAHWRPMVPIWQVTYLRFADQLKAVAVDMPAIADLISDEAVVASTDQGQYAAEAIFARLLPAWDAFAAALPQAERASSLGAMLRQAAQTIDVAPLGMQGDVVDYDPLSQHLADETTGPPTRVTIVRAGVQAHRVDGSTRVLVPALVLPWSESGTTQR